MYHKNDILQFITKNFALHFNTTWLWSIPRFIISSFGIQPNFSRNQTDIAIITPKCPNEWITNFGVLSSSVASTLDDPVQGWTDNLYGMNGAIVGAGCGILRVLHSVDELKCDIIPADFVINGTLVAGHRATESYKIEPPSTDPGKAHIYHVTSGTDNPLTNREIQDFTKSIGTQYPPLKSLWVGSYISTRYKMAAWILTILLHFFPGVILDAVQRFRGKKSLCVY